MSLFGRKPDPNEERRQHDRERLERGALPLDAERRLTDLRNRSNFFTSNLSVNEFVLATKQGLTQVGQVMGSCVYHVGWQFTPTYVSGEMSVLSHAYSEACRIALSRLQQEAHLLGAHGVVGVRIERQNAEWGTDLVEFATHGTAIRFANRPPSIDLPFLSGLSGQEYWVLHESGYAPVGVAFGTCIYYQIASPMTQYVTQGGFFGQGYPGNVEVSEYQYALQFCRQTAVSRLEQEAKSVHADGIVGMKIAQSILPYEVDVNNQHRRDLIVEFTALGTAIVSAHTTVPVVNYTLELNT